MSDLTERSRTRLWAGSAAVLPRHPRRKLPFLAKHNSKGKCETPPLLMEIGSLHNVLVINSEHTGTSAAAESALYKQEDAETENRSNCIESRRVK